MGTRKVVRVVQGKAAVDGAGVHLQRVIGYHDVEDFDPFLMLDAFDSKNPQDYIAGFPWHPHRGIETVTYLIKGEMDHGDSLGNRGRITGGSSQWMTAGGGIIHQEMPQPSEHMLGAQLWINLPRKDKMTEPEYNDIKADSVVKVTEVNATVAVISGDYKGHTGPAPSKYVRATYLDVDLQPDKTWEADVVPENTVFLYIIMGTLEIDGRLYENRRAVLFGDGDRVTLKAGRDGARFLLLSGKPLKEPVAWGGPIVMNTKEELDQAFREIDEGTFVRGHTG